MRQPATRHPVDKSKLRYAVDLLMVTTAAIGAPIKRCVTKNALSTKIDGSANG